ncbi:MAG: flippase-like domain-containing protein [Clostridia bacterium]|nr:flippase-like domain-containing protein [Clostridia bacterium]
MKKAKQLSMDLEVESVKTKHKTHKKKEKKVRATQLSMEELAPFKQTFFEVGSRQRKAKRIFTAVFIVFILGALAFTFYQDFGTGKELLSFKEILEVVGKNYKYLLFAFVALFLYIFLEVLKVFIMLYVTTKKPMFKVALITVMMGKYYDNITPFATGGQAFQVFNLTKNGVDGGTAAAIPISALFLSQVAFSLLSIVAIIFDSKGIFGPSITTDATRVFFYIGLATLLLIPFLVLLFFMMPKVVMGIVAFIVKVLAKLKLIKNPDLLKYKGIVAVKRYYKAIKRMASSKGCLFCGFITSLLIPIAAGSITYFVLRTFGYDLPETNGILEWAQMVCAHLILTCTVVFIPTPGNAGASEISFYSLFTVNLLGGIGVTAMLTWRFFIYYFFIIFGVLFVFIKALRVRRKEKKKKALL